METKDLAIDLLRIDADTQSRIGIDEDVVEEYAELIAESGTWPFPPVDVFADGTPDNYMMADGFHRYLAGQRAKRASIPCRIHPGTAFDARVFAMTANDKHGLRMTRKDKRACVEWLLDNYKMTQKVIAAKAGVSVRTVKTIVADRNPTSVAGKLPKGQIAPSTPSSGGSDPFDEVDEGDPVDVPETSFQVEDEEEEKPEKPNGKPNSEASVILDCFDRPVPTAFRDAQATAGSIATQARRLDPLLRDLLSLSEEPGGEYLPRSTLETEVKALKARIMGACYGFECPKCEGVIGKSCKFCMGRGWVPIEKRGKLSKADKEYLGID